MSIVLSCGSIRDDELVCEEAVSRLEDCCPSFEPRRFSCDRGGCNPNVPALDERAADCVRERACGDLQSKGICENLIRLSNQPYPSSLTDEIEREACK